MVVGERTVGVIAVFELCFWDILDSERLYNSQQLQQLCWWDVVVGERTVGIAAVRELRQWDVLDDWRCHID